jgi:hypothetical protein
MSRAHDLARLALLAVIALALAWLALRPHLVPIAAEAGRETVSVNLERIGGQLLLGGTILVRCAGHKP